MRNNKANHLYNSNWYNLMEGDHTVLIFGICASLAIGAYVFFGPNFVSRKKTPVLGLQNLGQTCFMNTILQALGSCPIFIKWLDSQTQSLGEVGHALRNILFRLGQVASKESSEYSIQPLEFMSVLSQHGWQMNLYNNMQQDAHELMTFILSKLEDEIFLNLRNQRNGLSCLDRDGNLEEDGDSSLSLSQGACPSGDTGRRENLMKKRRSLSLQNTNTQTHCASPFRGRLVSQIRCAVCGHENPLKYDNFDSLSLHLPQRSGLAQSHTLQGLLEDFVNTEIINEFECDMCNKNSNSATHTSGDMASTVSPLGQNAAEVATITSRAAHSDMDGQGVSTLDSSTAMLGDFNRSETPLDTPHSLVPERAESSSIPGDAGGGRSEPGPGVTPRRRILCDAVRTLRIGKLPPCLCFHVHRTCYSSTGAYKRPDYVDFPEYLEMDAYTYNSTLREREVKKQLVTRLNGAFPHDIHSMDSNRWARASNVYRLKAVIVHRGSAEDGHFVTYRRGPLSSLTRHRSLPPTCLSFESRWYYTSDADIRESSLAQALKSAAYMLFYERCTSVLSTEPPTTNGCAQSHEGDTSSTTRLTNGHCIT